MNQPNASIHCPHCNLVNFAAEPFCKRCKNSLQHSNYSADTNSVNINISFPTSVQPRITAQPSDQPFAPPPFNQPPPFSESGHSSEYQLQNQTGFQQWQQDNRPQINQQSNQHLNQPAMNAPFYPPPGYAMAHHPNTVWRRGGELVLHRYVGTMPDACVKCGEQIGGYAGGAFIRQKFRWHNPLVYIALISPLIYCILSVVLSQRVQVSIPLCSKHLEARKSTGKALFSGGVGAMMAIFFFSSFGYVGLSVMIFLAAFVGIILGYEYAYKPLQISKIENDYIYLKNADNNYLSRLPNC